ncbi:hypothetical protein BBP40_003796 [Aspergillus hancockii]|nr:hypothetical protein BBP40_003796 [Aspergillus hancockii]
METNKELINAPAPVEQQSDRSAATTPINALGHKQELDRNFGLINICSHSDHMGLLKGLLTEYEQLFDHSTTMRELLQASYIDIIRFWRRVGKECHRIGNTAGSMSRLILVVQERMDRGEHENAAEERRLAGISRKEQAAFKMFTEEMDRRNEER